MVSFEDVGNKNVCIRDPFETMGKSVEEVIEKSNLEYLGPSVLKGSKCHLFRCWDAKVFDIDKHLMHRIRNTLLGNRRLLMDKEFK
jgi:hypothetical protein